MDNAVWFMTFDGIVSRLNCCFEPKQQFSRQTVVRVSD